MKWLAEQIRELGLKPGIWFAPYVIAEGTEIYREAPRLADAPTRRQSSSRSARGLPKTPRQARRPNPEAVRARHHPSRARPSGCASSSDTAANDWGYDFIKIDFVDWSLLAADRYHDPTVTPGRPRIARVSRSCARPSGPKRHLLDCGPGPVTRRPARQHADRARPAAGDLEPVLPPPGQQRPGRGQTLLLPQPHLDQRCRPRRVCICSRLPQAQAAATRRRPLRRHDDRPATA